MHLLIEIQHSFYVVCEHLTIAKILSVYYQDHLISIDGHFDAHAVDYVAEVSEEVLF